MFLSKWSLGNALVKMLAICCLVTQKFMEIFPISTLSLRKWWQMSMCFVLLCCTWFFSMLIVLVLSQKIGTHLTLRPKSLSCCLIHNSWAQHEAVATYLYSTIDSRQCNKVCFFHPQEIRKDPKNWSIPMILFLSAKYPTKSASTYPINSKLLLFGYHSPK